MANRVAAIQEILPATRWAHVRTDLNPADLATRGVPLAELVNTELWWCGPSWLRAERPEWPAPSSDVSLFTEEEVKRASHHGAQAVSINELLERFSTFSRLIRDSPVFQILPQHAEETTSTRRIFYKLGAV